MATVLFRTLIIYVLFLVILRMLGKRQVGELEVSELVASLILSEIAAMPIDNPDIPLFYALVPIVLIFSLEVIITYCKNKSALLKRIFETRPNILIDKGEIRQEELSHMRISIEELVAELRLQGVADPNDVYYAVLEQSGQLSIILKADKQPPTHEALGIPTEEKGIAHPLILDGDVCKKALGELGKNQAWLEKECRKHNCRIDDVFLFTLNDAGDTNIIRRKNT